MFNECLNPGPACMPTNVLLAKGEDFKNNQPGGNDEKIIVYKIIKKFLLSPQGFHFRLLKIKTLGSGQLKEQDVFNIEAHKSFLK